MSLESNGLLEPIVITKQNTIISGHRRVEAMIQLGWTTCDARVTSWGRSGSEIIALIEHNNHRQKTHADILNEMRYLEDELKEQIGRGRKARQDRQSRGKNKNLRLALELANKIGLKETQVKKLRRIAKYEPQLIDKIDKGKITLNKAHELVRKKHGKETGRNSRSVNEFEVELKKLLESYQPTAENVQETLKKIFPYSLSLTETTEERRDELINHLEYLKQMDSHEYTLAQKQDELLHSEFTKQELRHAKSYLPTLKQLEKFVEWDSTKDIDVVSKQVKKKLEVIIVGDGEITRQLWNVLCVCIHNMEHVEGPGRRMSAVVGFRVGKKLKILGLISFQSPSRTLRVRDEYIGWTSEQMTKYREHIVNLHICVSSQPFGHNFLGGKLLSMMSLELVTAWEKKYKTKLVGIETTALHGEFCQYSSMKWWKKLGTTEGKILLRPFRNIRTFWRNWLKENYEDVYEDSKSRPSPLQNMLKNIYTFLGLQVMDYRHGLKRGVYFCQLYMNTVEFLTGESKKLISLGTTKRTSTNNLFENGKDEYNDDDVYTIREVWFDWWFEKSTRRYGQLVAEKESNELTLFHEPTDEHYRDIERWLGVRGLSKPIDTTGWKF